jgi:hypothetical protein
VKAIKLPLLALAGLLAQIGNAQADNISVRVSYGEVRNGAVFTPVRAEVGDFGLTPLVAAGEGAWWRVQAKNAQGEVLHETLVRNEQQRHVEVFDQKSGAIAHAANVRQASGVFEVSLPFDADVASVEVLPYSAGKALAPAAALAKFDRATLQNVANGAKHVRALSAGGTPAATATTIIESGPPKQRMDYVFVGDGYTAAEMGKWHADAQKVIDGFLADPLFKANRAALNVHRVDVASNESGADEIDKGIYKDTAMGGAFGCYNLDRLLCMDNDKVLDVVSSALPPDKRDVIIVVSNSTRYGGSGGAVATLSMHPLSTEVALHEIGHTAFKLADEYEYGDCNLAWEPEEGDVSRDWQRSVKWGSQILPTTPVPTLPGMYPNGTVGTFQGAQYCYSGKYRPTENSRMRTLNYPWHAVNEKLAQTVFAAYVAGPQTVTESGTLAAGDIAYFPSGSPGFLKAGNGLINLRLKGPAHADFDLELYKSVNGAWTRVAASNSGSANENLRYTGTAGYYYFQVMAKSGSGNYSFSYTVPIP